MAELYQIVGAILRDVSQARFMSDLYSRQISFSYENDSLLRRFPVPRGEIEEVEFNLPFVIREVAIDETRHQSRNAAVGRVFDDFSVRIVRAGLAPVQEAFEKASAGLPPDAKDRKAVADRFEGRILSEDFRVTLHGRLLRYLNEETDDLFPAGSSQFNTEAAVGRIHQVIADVQGEPEVAAFESQFHVLNDAFAKADAGVRETIGKMAAAVDDALRKYPDYSVNVDVSPEALKDNPAGASYIKVKAVVKNYRWTKVDVDSKDMRNLRTLAPE